MMKNVQICLLFLILSACGQKEMEKKTPENVNGNFENSEQQIKPEKEERWTDEHGNIFIHKGNEVSIIPSKYEQIGKTYKVFLFNETSNEIKVSERLKIPTNEFKVFTLVDTDTLELNNGVKFIFGETYGLEIEDKKSQVSGLGGEFLVKYGVPDEAEWAFVIVPEGEGD
jgi:predicted small lipoprotein YifL